MSQKLNECRLQLKTNVEGPRRRKWKQEHCLLIYGARENRSSFVCVLGEKCKEKREKATLKRCPKTPILFPLKSGGGGDIFSFLQAKNCVECKINFQFYWKDTDVQFPNHLSFLKSDSWIKSYSLEKQVDVLDIGFMISQLS